MIAAEEEEFIAASLTVAAEVAQGSVAQMGTAVAVGVVDMDSQLGRDS